MPSLRNKILMPNTLHLAFFLHSKVTAEIQGRHELHMHANTAFIEIINFKKSKCMELCSTKFAKK